MDGSIQGKLGSSLSGNSNRRGMKFKGTTTSHKCIGNNAVKLALLEHHKHF